MSNFDIKQLKRIAQYKIAAISFWDYCKLKDPKFYREDRTYLKSMCDTLQKFVETPDIQLLLMCCPPRTGKSYTLQHFAQWILGNNPDNKVMTGSYNETLSTVFAKAVRNAIMERKVDEDRMVFSDVFPDVKIKEGDASMNLWSLEGHYANYLATSPTGTATGFGATCFPAGTMVATDKGDVDISEIYNNTQEYNVISYNIVYKYKQYKRVVASRKSEKDDMVELVTVNGTVLQCTSDHLVYVQRKGWMMAKELKKGDKLLILSAGQGHECQKMRGNTEETLRNTDFVLSIRTYTQKTVVYDIQVEDNHNFYANGILVHNCILIDDLIKNALEAFNDRVKQDHWDWFSQTMLSRLEEGGKIIICATRWHLTDLCGRIKEHYIANNRPFLEITYKALNDDGSTICEELLSRKSLEEKRAIMGEEIFMANYQQEPIDIKGRLYTNIKTYDTIPCDGGGTPLFTAYKAYVDTADKGQDYLVCIAYGVYKGDFYILDVLFTQAPMETTEPATAKLLNTNNIREADIESNNGGRGFARNVDRILKEELGNTHCVIRPFTQTANKEARILSNATTVMEHILFPSNWTTKWAELAKQILNYQREGKNAHDDAPDVLTGIIERNIHSPIKLNPAILRNRY